MLLVLRPQVDFLASDRKPLYRGFVLQQRNKVVTVLRYALLSHHHQVTLSDSDVHHAVSSNLQGEAPTCPGRLPRGLSLMCILNHPNGLS